MKDRLAQLNRKMSEEAAISKKWGDDEFDFTKEVTTVDANGKEQKEKKTSMLVRPKFSDAPKSGSVRLVFDMKDGKGTSAHYFSEEFLDALVTLHTGASLAVTSEVKNGGVTKTKFVASELVTQQADEIAQLRAQTHRA